MAEGNGGIGAVGRLTAAALRDRCRIRALACQDHGRYEAAGVEVRGFGDRRARFALANAWAARASTHAMYDHAGTARAHINLVAGRTPFAVWVHGVEIWDDPRADYLQSIRRASIVIANSAYTVARAGKVLDGLNVKVCELGTFADTAGPAPRRDGPPTVMLLGRADQWFAKGHDLLIEVWPRVVSAVPDARLLLVGGGPELPRVQRLAAASSAQHAIEIAGFVPDDRLEQYWRRATVFAMPGSMEGFGIVYIEAMRRSIPVVAATDDAGHDINVDGVTGMNVARADRARLAEVLIHLLRDRDDAARLGRGGLARWRDRFAFSHFKSRLVETTSGFLSGN